MLACNSPKQNPVKQLFTMSLKTGDGLDKTEAHAPCVLPLLLTEQDLRRLCLVLTLSKTGLRLSSCQRS